MLDLYSYFESVGDIWFAWVLSILAVGWLLRRGIRSVGGWRQLVRVLGRDDDGASYVLPYVMVFPIYFLLVCVMIQTTLILIVKIGTVHASYSAARAAIVWRSVEPDAERDHDGEKLAQKMAHKAAMIAMTPFASSRPNHFQKMYYGIGQVDAYVDAWSYQDAYRHIVNDNINQSHEHGAHTMSIITNPDFVISSAYSSAKLKFASRATSVEVKSSPNQWNEDVTVKLSYVMPMIIPGAGRLLGNPKAPFNARTIETTVQMPSETPKGSGRIGIGYDPRQ